ncbi:hypothetical protein GX50_04473 [[Emmonsia] crescens]|uniref:Uncharacterized protein n=1 Tax=[Emmonsia] crescens TaxID=73230 RepID=A0A2B7ZHW3_9EURO|nr:hypothetical protein GX50_04473 [Emmonsia crescens]
MTPRMYASVSNNKDMTTLLDPCLPLDAETSSVQDASSISPKYMELLAGFFEDAISEGNLLECQRLYFAGCSLDTNMPNCHGCSPMIKTLLYKQLNILDWLLQCKATTTLKEGGNIFGDGHQIEWAIINDNIEGLRIFLDFVKEKAESIR